MLKRLQEAVEARLRVPISNYAISVPPVTALEATTIGAALETAGLHDLSIQHTYLNAASAALIDAKPNLQTLDAPLDQNVLVLEYHAFALISSFFSSSSDSLHPAVVDETSGGVARNANIFASDEAYWNAFRAAVQLLPQRLRWVTLRHSIDVVVLVGQALVGGKVKENVEQVFDTFCEQGYSCGRPILLDCETGFATARGAAVVAANVTQKKDNDHESNIQDPEEG